MSQDTNGLIAGLIISLFEDFGPSNIFNSSPLSSIEALNMTVKGMTTLGTESKLELGEIRSYGPIPTPREPYISIGFFFNLKALQSEDTRIMKTGRLVVFWIITKSTTTLSYIGLIKQMIRRVLRTYKIQTDEDLRNEDILVKINEKLKIIETGVETYYITQEMKIESFLNLALVPESSPVVLVDNNFKKIEVLMRKRPSPSKKLEYISIVKEFREKIPKGSLFKVEAITDEIAIQRLLSKEGLIVHKDLSDHFRIRLTDRIAFEEIDEFLDHHLTPIRNKIASSIIQAYEKNLKLDLKELAIQIGLSEELILNLVTNLIKSNILHNAEVENNILRFN
ncbi:MAG: hypothetical protein ACFFAU_14730 [Candidatus Hodarchaeota archaeon]